jgi:hypothetical protein
MVVVDGRTGQSGAPAMSPLEALSSSGIGQSGAAPDRYFSLSGAPLATALTSACIVALTRAFAVDHCAEEPLLRWCTGQSGGTSDSPVNYSGARPEKPRVASWSCTVLVHRTLSGGTPDSPVRQTRAHSVSCSF